MKTKTSHANINDFLSESPEGFIEEGCALGHWFARLYHARGMLHVSAGGKTQEEARKNLSVKLARIEAEV